MRQRNVVVAMPFGRPGEERRKAILNFRRLKFIIEEKCQVVPAGSRAPGTRVSYDVEVARTITDKIPEKALMQIYDADILIALLSERNLTVAYELGYRRARERTVILMVDSEDDVPIYEAGVAYQSWQQDDVLKEIDSIAGKDFPPLDDFNVEIPGALKDVIDAKDDGLINGLQLALQEIENTFVEPSPDPVQKLRGILSDSIMRFYPISVVEVSFANNGEFEDSHAPARVVDFDEDFSRLYGYGGKLAALRDRPLTLDRLLGRIEKFSDPNDWNMFLEEQVKLTETVIKNYGYARATVPLRFNASHPDAQFRGKSFLPCMAAEVIDGEDGDLSGPHRMYLLIAYIEISNDIAQFPVLSAPAGSDS
jgi:nucleoside 2-deoxyribosyltransferase